MKNSKPKNLRIIASNAEGRRGFNIYLDFSGKKEYLTYHRHNAFRYSLTSRPN